MTHTMEGDVNMIMC